MPVGDVWNLADLWEVVAETKPDELFGVQGDRRLTWAETDRRADGVGRTLLDAGLVHQDKVAQYLYNCPEYLESVFACFKAGMAPVNTNYRYKDDELVYLWDNADVIAVVFHGTFTETIERMRDRVPRVRLWLWVDDASGPCPEWAVPYETAAAAGGGRLPGAGNRSGDDLYLLYTGGTTGKPKGVMWRQEDLFLIGNRTAKVKFPLDADRAGIEAVLRSTSGPRHLVGVPLMHGLGSITSFAVLCGGGAVLSLASRSFDTVEMLDTIEREKVNSIVIVGDALARPILEHLDAEPTRWDVSSLKVISSSGAMWSQPVKDGLSAHVPGAVLVDTVGSSEAVNLASSVSRAGAPAETAKFRIGEDTRVIAEDGSWVEPGSGAQGLLARKGPTSIGYYKDPVKSAETYRMIDGVRWSTPGDLATVAEDGTITLLGRGSNCINTAGEKVFPEEVEEALKEHPSVRDAIVLGLPDERLGERIVAAVETEGGSTFDEAELVEHVKARLASYKAPRQIHHAESLQRAATGKLDYPAWKARLVEAFSTAG